MQEFSLTHHEQSHVRKWYGLASAVKIKKEKFQSQGFPSQINVSKSHFTAVIRLSVFIYIPMAMGIVNVEMSLMSLDISFWNLIKAK
jgi:hypothetical protein